MLPSNLEHVKISFDLKHLFMFLTILSHDGSIESSDKGSNNQPQLVVKKIDSKSIHLSIYNLNQCSLILQLAKDKRLSETRSCLESNHLPVKINYSACL